MAKTKEVAKRNSAPGRYIAPARRPSYEYDVMPELHPELRHFLVTLEEEFKKFATIEDRIHELKDRVTEAEKRTVDLPEPAWHQLQFSMSTLQKELHDRVPAIERHFENLKMLVARMDRLEEKVDGLAKAVDELCKGSSH